MATTCVHGVTFDLLDIIEGGGCQECKELAQEELRERDTRTIANTQRRRIWLDKLHMDDVPWVRDEIEAAEALIESTRRNLP